MRAWRVEYASVFHIGPLDMAEMYPEQILAMDEQVAELRRKQNGG